MSESNGKPPVIEGPGRYAVYQAPDGWIVARAVGICQRCQDCGCGEQAEPIPLPDFTAGRKQALAWAMKHAGDLQALLGSG